MNFQFPQQMMPKLVMASYGYHAHEKYVCVPENLAREVRPGMFVVILEVLDYVERGKGCDECYGCGQVGARKRRIGEPDCCMLHRCAHC